MLDNFHTHTSRCHHAEGTVEDYVRAAVEAGMTTLGVSDHTPLPDNRWGEDRMSMNELTAYQDEIEQARAAQPSLMLRSGLECEYLSEFHAFFEDELLGERGFEYLIGAVHYVPNGSSARSWTKFHQMCEPKHLALYAKQVVLTMESGLFTFIAHPDLFGYAYPEWDAETTACARDILSAAQDLRIPLEINGYGMRKTKVMTQNGERDKYPWLPFWDLAAEYRVEIIASSDAHRPQDVAGNLEDCIKIADDRGLARADLWKDS